jgi:hypothetical protein
LVGWEGRAGYYVPELSKLIFENNKKLPASERINPVTDDYYDNWGYVDFLYYHAMISDQLFGQIKAVCNFNYNNATLSDPCLELLYYNTEEEYGLIDPYSVYAPACVSNISFGGNSTKFQNPRKKLFNPVCRILPICFRRNISPGNFLSRFFNYLLAQGAWRGVVRSNLFHFMRYPPEYHHSINRNLPQVLPQVSPYYNSSIILVLPEYHHSISSISPNYDPSITIVSLAYHPTMSLVSP